MLVWSSRMKILAGCGVCGVDRMNSVLQDGVAKLAECFVTLCLEVGVNVMLEVQFLAMVKGGHGSRRQSIVAVVHNFQHFITSHQAGIA